MEDTKIYNVSLNDKKREEIARKTEEFLARGGKIEVVDRRYRNTALKPRDWVLNEKGDRARTKLTDERQALLSDYLDKGTEGRKRTVRKIYKEIKSQKESVGLSKSQMADIVSGKIAAMYRVAGLDVKYPVKRTVMRYLQGMQ